MTVEDELQQLTWKELPEFRDQLLREQNNICPICNEEIEYPELDHHHTKKVRGTGKIRAILCNRCNTFLGKTENISVRCSVSQDDLPEMLRSAALYLERPQLNILHPSEAPKKPKLMKSSYNKLKRAINGKQKIPKYTGNMSKELEKLFDKYGVVPRYYGK